MRKLVLALQCAAAIVVAPVAAQDIGGNQALPAASDSNTLQQVTVTATKRQESLQKLPEAVTAITAVDLDKLNAQTFEDYFRTVPGLMLNSLGAGLNRFDFSLRGISTFSQLVPDENATVGQYLDEIPVTAVGQQIDPRLVDIDRIEVLRGPQGTYFGEDSLAGTIRIITKQPDLSRFDASVDARGSGTEHGGTNDSESLIVNVPIITGILGARAAYYNADDSGFIDGVTAGCAASSCDVTAVDSRRNNPDRSNGARLQMLFEPLDRVSLAAEFVHSYSVQVNTAIYEPKAGDLEIIQDDLNANAGPSGGNGGPSGGGGNSSTGGGGGAGPSGGGGTGGGGGGTGNMSTGGGSGAGSGAAPTGDLGLVTVTDQDNLYNFTARAELNFAELVSTSSWGYRTTTNAGPAPASSFSGIVTTYDDFAQELRLVSAKNWSDAWDYILGLYYQRQNELQLEYESASFGSIANDTVEKAVFGEAGYNLTSKLQFRLGLRREVVNFNEEITSPELSGLNADSGTNNPTTGRVLASYTVSDEVLLYSSISRGFRKGGTNGILPGVPAVYQPDTTTNYEIGWKLTLPDERATLDGAVYHIDWQDIQVAELALTGGGQQYFVNAGAAKVDGVELEGTKELIDGLSAQLSFSFMNPVLTQNQPGTSCTRGCPGRTGDQIPYDARVTGSLSLSYTRLIGNTGLEGFTAVSEQYTGKRNTDFAPTGPDGAANGLFREMNPNSVTNLQVGLQQAHFRVSVFADNVFDRRNQLSVTPSTAGQNGDEVLVDRPLTVGLWIRYDIR